MNQNNFCYVCDYPILYSRTRSGKYYCEKHNICATEKTKILKKRGRKELDEEQRILSVINKKENQKKYNRNYYVEKIIAERKKNSRQNIDT